MTGKYVHNHHTYANGVGAGCDAQSWRDLNEQKTMGPYMSKAGYTTGFFGIREYNIRSIGLICW